MAGEPRRRNWKRILLVILGATLIVVGAVVLFPISLLVDRDEIGSATFSGSVPAGELVVVPINFTDVGFVQLEAEVLPCGLSIGAFDVIEIEVVNETHVFPRGGIDCDNQTALVEAPATHVALLNEQPTAALTYRVHATYFTASIPFAWAAWVAFAFVLFGGIVLIAVLLGRV